jgi:hypothetical protein
MGEESFGKHKLNKKGGREYLKHNGEAVPHLRSSWLKRNASEVPFSGFGSPLNMPTVLIEVYRGSPVFLQQNLLVVPKNQWYSIFFVCTLRCTFIFVPPNLLVYNSKYTVYKLHIKK